MSHPLPSTSNGSSSSAYRNNELPPPDGFRIDQSQLQGQAGAANPTKSTPPVPSRPTGQDYDGLYRTSGYQNQNGLINGYGDPYGYPGPPGQAPPVAAPHTPSRRPLPAQPPAGVPPPNPYPASMSRRALPTPPSMSSAGAPAPPPRPSGRALPTVPGAGGSPSRTVSGPSQSRPSPQYTPPRSSTQSSAYPTSFPASSRTGHQSNGYVDSPPAMPSSSSYGQMGNGSFGPSRHSTLSQSHSSSSADPISRSTSMSYDPSVDTRMTSLPASADEHKFYNEGPEDESTVTTLLAPGRGPTSPTTPVGERSEVQDGRGTPTQRSWLQDPPPRIQDLQIDDPRQRTVSSSSFAMNGIGNPSAPGASRTRMENGYQPSSSVGFPVASPHLNVGESSRAIRHSAQSSVDSRFTSSTPDQNTPFPEPHPHPRPERQTSTRSSLHPSSMRSRNRRSAEMSASWGEQSQPPAAWVERKLQIHQSHLDDGYYDDDSSFQRDSQYEEEETWQEEEEEPEVDESRFFNCSLMSEMAVQLKDRVVKGRHTKAGIAWVGSFTGRDVVTTIQTLLPPYVRESNSDRRFALLLAHSLQNQLWFVEVDWDIKPLRDSAEDVFRFMGEMEGMGSGDALTGELPKGVSTMATRCYSPSCTGDNRCYAPRCPYRTSPEVFLGRRDITPLPTPARSSRGDWTEDVDPMVLYHLSPEQKNRQMIIHQAIQSEVQYEADLTAMERSFIQGLREAQPPVIAPPHRREEFIHQVFSNAMDLREAARRLLDNFAIRQREQPIMLTVGDIFLEAAAEFHNIYPQYTGNLPQAEVLLSQELEENPEFRLFAERVVRENDRRRDIKYLIARPKAQLQRYPTVIDAILQATDPENVDREFLAEALSSIQNLSVISQLKLFQASKGRGPAGKLQWYDLVSEEQRNLMDKKDQKRQMQIWELIQGEMEYVADLETIETLFVDGLRQADVPIIERSRLEIFVDDAFHNYRSLLEVHSDLLEKLQDRQSKQHPHFGMISDLILDAALNWQDAYMEYVTHYPIAKAKVEEEKQKNKRFAAFLETCLKNPASQRMDIFHYIYRPIPRLLRYNLLLADILKSTTAVGPPNHPDIDTIPQAMEIIGDLGKATQKGVAVNESKVELWTFQHTLDGSKFGPRLIKDLDLLNPMRELIHRGRVWRQPEGAMSSSWIELQLLLFDNYLVLAKTEKPSKSSRKEKNHLLYSVNRRPIPLELLSLGNFSDAPRARSSGNKIFGSSKDETDGPSEAPSDNRTVWPFTISFIGQGQLGGQYTLWTDSYATRADWQEKLQHAKVLRAEVNDAGKVFEMTPLSQDTFFVPANYAVPKAEGESHFTGRVTCSCPFSTIDGRSLVAVGCEEGVWIGLRHDPRSLRKVLHVKQVTNVAVLEDFGIFLVLQDKSLLAYHLEALVPSNATQQVRAAPQRLSTGKDIAYFTVGQLSGRTLVIYVKKKGTDSLFRVLEPVSNPGAEDRQRRPFGPLFGQKADWFRLYKDFFIPTDAQSVHFLKHKLAVVCAKGFEIMDLTDLKGGSIPIFDPVKTRDRPALSELKAKCDSTKPLAMFRSTETEFILCYETFGLYVDRHGEPNRDCQAIEWEGKPDSVAFHPPYLLLISAPFIEVRHIDNAKLLQIYTGSDIRLTWDGTGGMSRPFVNEPGPKGYGDEAVSIEPRVHICQRPEDVKRARGVAQGIGQHVFELTPTLLLNNPLLNPVHTHDSNYFPPAPPISHRPSSIMTTSTTDIGYGNVNNDQLWAEMRNAQRWD